MSAPTIEKLYRDVIETVPPIGMANGPESVKALLMAVLTQAASRACDYCAEGYYGEHWGDAWDGPYWAWLGAHPHPDCVFLELRTQLEALPND